MTGRTRAELEGRLAHHLKHEVERVAATVDVRKQQARLEERLRPIRRRRRPLYLSAAALATAAAGVAVAVLVSMSGSRVTATSPATEPSRAPTTFTSEFSLLAGLQLTWPSAGWRAMDYRDEVIIRPPGLPNARIRISKGLFPADPSGGFVSTRTSAVSVVAALRAMPTLEVSAPVHEHLGSGLAAVHVDMRLSSSAPHPGFAYLAYRGNSVNAPSFSITAGMRVRVYAAVYRAPYGNELLNIAVEAHTAEEFARYAALADRVLQTLRLPEGLVAGRTFDL